MKTLMEIDIALGVLHLNTYMYIDLRFAKLKEETLHPEIAMYFANLKMQLKMMDNIIGIPLNC